MSKHTPSKRILTENCNAKYKYCTSNMYLNKCASLNSITEHQERMIRSSGFGLHINKTALRDNSTWKNTEIANIANIANIRI